MSVKVEVWGSYACFSRPELKTERVSYDMITPSAAVGLLEAVYWHPGLEWVIDKIYVMAPIRLKRKEAGSESDEADIKMTSIKRNEVKSKISANNVRTVMTGGTGSLYINTSEERNQRSSLILQDVHYVIEAHFNMTDKAAPGDNPGKFQDIMRRRLEKGQFYHQPCFGVREFPAHFKPCTEFPPCPEELLGEKDLGWMLLDLDYSDPENITPHFFRAVLHDGVLEVPPMYSEEVRT